MTRHIVVAYDFSEPADLALERAVEIACRAPEHVLHFITAIDPHHGLGLEPDEVVDYRYAEHVQAVLAGRLHAIFEAREAQGEVHFFVHARIGRPVEEILFLAADIGADLIVVGSHGRTGVTRLILGSVSEIVVRKARCPVIVARAKTYRDVELAKVVDVPESEHSRYIRPHRYSYSSNRVITRPPDFPLN